MEVNLYFTDSGDPWGVWAFGHMEKEAFLPTANAELRASAFDEAELSQVEHGYARFDREEPEFNLMKAFTDEPGAFPITLIKGEDLSS